MIKRCNHCHQDKDVSCFSVSRTRKDGLQPRCRDCNAIYNSTPKAKKARAEYQLSPTGKRLRQARNASPEAVAARRKRHLASYGITVEEYDALFAAQGGRCGICYEPETMEKAGVVLTLSVDHDHDCCPGKRSCGGCVRGLLCYKCNIGLGMFADSPDLLTSAVSYLGGFNAY